MWNSQKWIPILLFQQCGVWHHWWITGPYIFPQSLIGDMYAKLFQYILPASPLQEGSTVNMTSDVLPAWWPGHSFQSECHAISESAISSSWCWAELATMVNVRDSVRLTCMGIHEHHDVCMVTFQWCNTHKVHFIASYGYTFPVQMVQKMYPSRWRPHWTTNQ
jgi:hypothetical protein